MLAAFKHTLNVAQKSLSLLTPTNVGLFNYPDELSLFQ